MARPMKMPDLEREDLELIECSRQPGRLLISKYACGLRYLKAQRMDPRIPDDEFGMAVKWGLEVCRTCPEGRIHSQDVKKGPVLRSLIPPRPLEPKREGTARGPKKRGGTGVLSHRKKESKKEGGHV